MAEYIYIYMYNVPLKYSLRMFLCLQLTEIIKFKCSKNFFKIPTNNFSHFEDFTFLLEYLYVHLIHKFGIFAERIFG